MFDEKLIIMVKTPQPGPAGNIITWSEGEEITAKFQVSNMLKVQIAQAQGVKPTGYLVVNMSIADKIGLDTYLRYPKGGYYARVADNGVVEAGSGMFGERQFAVEIVQHFPT